MPLLKHDWRLPTAMTAAEAKVEQETNSNILIDALIWNFVIVSKQYR